ncbi:MAG: NrfD/PsrC family molybdoenzyme membrane anchor subunit [Thermodesulfobacteriota bacterium]
MKDKVVKGLLALSILGMLVGAWGIIEALGYGLNATALGSYTPWGLGVILYLYFLGLSAGGFMVTIIVYIFGKKQYDVLSPLAAWLVIVTEVCAIIPINLDLGHWERTYLFILSPNFLSPMMWMFVFFAALFLVYLLKAWYYYKKDEAKIRVLSIISLPVGLFFYGINGYLFAILTGYTIWNSPLTPVMFIVAALLSGGALMTFLTWIFYHERELVYGLGRSVFILLLTFVGLEALNILLGYRGHREEAAAALNHMLFGSNWGVFWFLHLLVGTLIPIFLLAKYGRNHQVTAWSCLIIALAFMTVRIDFVLPAQYVGMLKGLDKAFIHERLRLSYHPNLGEWLVGVFITSLGLFSFLVGPKVAPSLFPLKEEKPYV